MDANVNERLFGTAISTTRARVSRQETDKQLHNIVSLLSLPLLVPRRQRPDHNNLGRELTIKRLSPYQKEQRGTGGISRQAFALGAHHQQRTIESPQPPLSPPPAISFFFQIPLSPSSHLHPPPPPSVNSHHLSQQPPISVASMVTS